MTKRREFPRAVKVATIKRATKDSIVYCERCGGLAKKFQIDHIIADSHGGEPVLENAMLICDVCYSEKNPKDTTIAAKLKRVEAKHIGAATPKQPIASRPFARKPRPEKIGLPKPRQIYEDVK